MIEKLKSLFGKEAPQVDRSPEKLHLAAAVLMVEAAFMDGEFTEEERSTIDTLLKQHFGLSDADTTELIALAEEEHEVAGHLFRYTKAIKDALDEQERLEIIELLWQVVYADGESHAYEANLLRRIAGLIYVSDRDRGDARKRVLARMGVNE
ncbi:MAG: TerB family tellurite resistance protein [Alphaproteobacteria bacterium]